MRPRCGAGAAAWVAGVLAAPGPQGGWRLGLQEVRCSRKAWQPVLTDTLQCSCLENPALPEKPIRPQSTGSQRLRGPCALKHEGFSSFGLCSSVPARAEHAGAAAAWLAGTLRRPCAGTDRLCCRRPTPPEAFLQPRVAGDQRASLASLSPYLCPLRQVEGALDWGPAL